MILPKYNLWLERDGEVVLSGWRVRLLQAVGQTGSITGAAELVGVPYRRAWERLKEMESRLGLTLVETEVGGAGGGGARLTEDAQDLISRFIEFSGGFETEVEARFHQAFDTARSL
ncbi:MAG TPA: LysR family transcriptional regulator [Anaerolineales bacterium]|nr:LysR family transcriptional regulator [Anaerolineales bacterium]